MRNLTIVDRMVLESINKSDKNITAIQIDTSLPIKIINSVIENLLAQGFINLSKNHFIINPNMTDDLKKFLKDETEVISQIKSLICECVHQSMPDISFYKIAIKPDDMKILNTLFYNVESFIKGLKKTKGITKDETFVFWGKENYAKAIHSYIS